MNTGNIESIRIGWVRESGWSALVTRMIYGNFRNTLTHEQFQKHNGERLWEDEDGWYVDPDSPLHAKLEAELKRYMPAEVTT